MTSALFKRLIEVDLPIKRISAHARREKSIRHGHISTLHIWWARRPLAACRAVICAALWPDPADSACPDNFRGIARREMARWANECLNLVGSDSYSRFLKLRDDPNRLNDDKTLRDALLDFIADFANWDNSTVPEYLSVSRALTRAAHEAVSGVANGRPLLVDPFAGGGAIPLEALRVGADAFATDLNPVAVLLDKVTLEYIPKFGVRLAEEVRRWGECVKQKTESELKGCYPSSESDGKPIAYLWARTIRCEGPGCGTEVPLLRSLWVAKRSKNSVAVRIVPDSRKKRVEFEVVEKASAKDIGEATVRKGSVTCPVCGFTTPITSVRSQLKARNGGSDDARLFCVVTVSKQTLGRNYRTPVDADFSGLKKASQVLREREQNNAAGILSIVPDEQFSGIEPRRIPLPQYGINGFRHLFGTRQALVLSALASSVSAVFERIAKEETPEFATAIATCLGLAVDRIADQMSSIVVWSSGGEFVTHTFGRQALPMAWDFAEPQPFAGAGGDFGGAVEWIAKVCEREGGAELHPATVGMASADQNPLPNDVSDAFITDPPYYYSVPYSDLSDFFYVWLKRSCGNLHPDLFTTAVTPKANEIVQNLPHSEVAHLQKDRQFFETRLEKALAEGRRINKDAGIGLIVFAHTETAAWEAMLSATINAGWMITASWPIDTERAARIIATRQSTLASSVHLVCRPRSGSEIGDWRDVLQKLPRRIHDWMPRLAEEGVVGADAIFACLGPALEVFSSFDRVEKASGEAITLKEYLEYVWAAVAKEALSMVFKGADASGFEEDARLTAIWLWTLFAGQSINGDESAEESDDETDDTALPIQKGFVLEYDTARKIAQGLGAHLESLTSLVNVKGDTARLLSVSERTRGLFGKDESQAPSVVRKKKPPQLQLGFVEELERAEEAGTWGSKGAPAVGASVLDRVHQSMILFAAGRSEALRSFLVDEGVGRDERFWRLAQVLSYLYPKASEEKRWIDGILARKKGLGF